MVGKLKVYVDPGPSNAPLKTNLAGSDGWHRSSIRNGVVNQAGETEEFIEWKSRCAGRVILQPEPIDETGNYVKIPRWYVYFEKTEDLAFYILSFDEKIAAPEIDVAVFYCPYVPITHSGVVNATTVKPAASFVTRYGKLK